MYSEISLLSQSVVVTDDNAADVDFFFSSMSGLGLHAGSSFAGMANGGQSVASLTGGGSAGGGGGCGSPSVPLLSDHPHGSGGGNNIVTIESSLSTPQLHHSQQQQRGGDAPPNNANIKPIARTIATIKRALFSKTARKVRLLFNFFQHFPSFPFSLRFVLLVCFYFKIESA